MKQCLPGTLEFSQCLPQRILNEVDEIVSVSDPVTHRILYLNDFGKKSLGVTDLSGKKCYTVLHGKTDICPFCTNTSLNTETFSIIEYTHPVLQRHYLLKCKLIEWENRLLRLEFATDITETENTSQDVQRKLAIERMLLECLCILNREEDFSKAINMILRHLGIMHKADRAYIFEYIYLEGGNFVANNTYEWCSEGVSAQKDFLQRVPGEWLQTWQASFERREDVSISCLESIKDSAPQTYAVLKAQGITSLLVVPLILDGVISGFIGVDNPTAYQDEHSLLHSLAYFVTCEQKKHNLQCELKRMSYRDDLTGLHNRNSYISTLRLLEKNPPRYLGVVFADLNGLKRLNDQYGHSTGDTYIRNLSEVFIRYFNEDEVFRIGGDEFVFLCPNLPEQTFYQNIVKVRRDAAEIYPDPVSIGGVWAENHVQVMDMVKQADRLMYKEKSKHYAKLHQNNPSATPSENAHSTDRRG